MKLGDLQLTEEGRAVIARLTGEIDLSNADTIGDAVTRAMPNTALLLVLDMTGLDYLDSAGIHLIYQLREKLRARGQKVHLVVAHDSPAHDTLRLSGVANHVDSSEKLADALAQLEP